LEDDIVQMRKGEVEGLRAGGKGGGAELWTHVMKEVEKKAGSRNDLVQVAFIS
jgi:hypothetical protein